MSVTRLREIIWIVSILLTAGLGWYVYEIIDASRSGAALVDKGEVERNLQDVEDMSGPKHSLVDRCSCRGSSRRLMRSRREDDVALITHRPSA